MSFSKRAFLSHKDQIAFACYAQLTQRIPPVRAVAGQSLGHSLMALQFGYRTRRLNGGTQRPSSLVLQTTKELAFWKQNLEQPPHAIENF